MSATVIYLPVYLSIYSFIHLFIFLKVCPSTLPSHREGFKQLPWLCILCVCVYAHTHEYVWVYVSIREKCVINKHAHLCMWICMYLIPLTVTGYLILGSYVNISENASGSQVAQWVKSQCCLMSPCSFIFWKHGIHTHAWDKSYICTLKFLLDCKVLTYYCILTHHHHHTLV